MAKARTFQDLILTLPGLLGEKRGCVILQPYDLEMGAGKTLVPATTLHAR